MAYNTRPKQLSKTTKLYIFRINIALFANRAHTSKSTYPIHYPGV